MRAILFGVSCLHFSRLVAGFQFVTRPLVAHHQLTNAVCSIATPCRGRHKATSTMDAGELRVMMRYRLPSSCWRQHAWQRMKVLPAVRHMLSAASLKHLCGVFWKGPQKVSNGGMPSGISATDHGVLMSAGALALPVFNRLFTQASNLFQVGVLLGPLPTVLAALVTAYWAWQVGGKTAGHFKTSALQF